MILVGMLGGTGQLHVMSRYHPGRNVEAMTKAGVIAQQYLVDGRRIDIGRAAQAFKHRLHF